ncbi:MAG: amino acid permease [Sporocytophaga sp.]|uniref:amino acid permease n=1 Tax=Sporocytophaga sp. TaxID=2231183 RepID=UPI001B28C4FE|nr:amino acid permease [Sporocytophaga sp.]MBO9700395.1 amino acid permease [Sporocytophaga sp.]
MGRAVNKESLGNGKIGAFSLWAIGVSLVISGESFGWNIGWSYTGPFTFFIPFFISALMYYALVNCLVEFACVYPLAAGPHIYVKNAFGKSWGEFISLALLIEFLFATPAIANSIGEYLGFLNNNLDYSPYIATCFLTIFCLINLFDLNLSVLFAIILTMLALVELMIYQVGVVPYFNISNLIKNNYGSADLLSMSRALPFAIWMFLAIEGLSLFTSKVRKDNFRKHISLGYFASFWTLLVFAVLILLLAGTGVGWSDEAWSIISKDSHPMPASLSMILPANSGLVKVFTFIGLFGLIASLQGVLLAATIQLEHFFKRTSLTDKQKRLLATVLIYSICLIAVWGSQTSFLIELSVLGAVSMYFAISLSLLRLRSLGESNSHATMEGRCVEFNLNYTHNDFNKTKSTTFAWIALLISFVSIIILSYSLPIAAGLFFVLIIIFGIKYFNSKVKEFKA